MVIRRRHILTGAAAAAAIAVIGYRQTGRTKVGNAITDDSATPVAGTPVAGTPVAVIPAARPLGEHPNILLLCIDDLNDWVGYMAAHPGVYTPNIDKLRAQSYSFNRAYCPVPVCIASRASVLWGLRPESTHVQAYGAADESAYWALKNSTQLHPLPYWFSQAGYETISTGKVFHYQKGTPRVWDVYQPFTELPPSLGDHGTFFDYGISKPGEVHADQLSANFAVEQLQKTRTKPWFMAIGLFQPHTPWRLPQWAFDLHPLAKVVLPEVRADDLDDIPQDGVEIARSPSYTHEGKEYNQYDIVRQSGLWPQHVQAYLAACSHTDAIIGQILAALDTSSYANNTAVVLWSDNGFHLGEKLHWHKMALWEQATRVPLLIRAPGRVEAGGGFDLPVSLLDLAPTLTDLAGIPTPAQFEGSSLIGITPQIASSRPANMRWGNAVSTRVGKWRWTRYPDGGEELYDLSTDPREYHNLLGKTEKHAGGIATLL